MHVREWQSAARNVLEYIRDPRRSLNIGRRLGPALLPEHDPCSVDTWTLADDWALTAALKELIRSMIVHFRDLAGIENPVVDSALEHRRMLKHDITQGRADLKFWSLLWAYYICAMSHDEIAAACNWSVRTSQIRLKEARTIFLVQKLVELECCQRHDETGRDHHARHVLCIEPERAIARMTPVLRRACQLGPSTPPVRAPQH
jgi:hypothetical protein